MTSFVSASRSIVYGQTLGQRLREALRSTPWWVLSLAVHLGVLLFAYTYTWDIPLPKDDATFTPDLLERPVWHPTVIIPVEPRERLEKPTRTDRPEPKRETLSHAKLPMLPRIVVAHARDERPLLVGTSEVTRVDTYYHDETTRQPPDYDRGFDDLPPDIFKGRCLIVWLFDESRSMKDDQQRVRETVSGLYENLAIDAGDARERMTVVSAVASFGSDFHVLLKSPTPDVEKVRDAMARIPVDETGRENVLAAVNGVLNEFADYVRRFGRKIVIIVVTDEAGDDVDAEDGVPLLEATVARMKRQNAALIVFGAEAGAFAYPFERIYDPTVPAGTTPWATVKRGVDAAFDEMIAHDWHGFRSTHRLGSGFGPWALTRLSRETGGVYNVLRDVTARSYDYRKLLDGYEAELESRQEITRRNQKNPVRHAIVTVVEQWKAIRDKEDRHFSVTFGTGKPGRAQMETSMEVVNEWIRLTADGIGRLESLMNVSFKEAPKRWGADRDLMLAQLYKTRFQLFQFKLALTDLMRGHRIPMPGDGGWVITTGYDPVIRGDAAAADAEIARVRAMFQELADKHAGTPWEAYARSEMRSMGGYAIRGWSPGRDADYKTWEP